MARLDTVHAVTKRNNATCRLTKVLKYSAVQNSCSKRYCSEPFFPLGAAKAPF